MKHIFVFLELETFCSFEHLEKVGNVVGVSENEKAGSCGGLLTREAVCGPWCLLGTYRKG